jgi:hypothetical protein
MSNTERSGRVLDRADCTGAADGSGSFSFAGSGLIRLGYACQAVITLPSEPTATLSWQVALNTLPLFPLPGGSSLGPMTILDGDTLDFSCTTGLVEGQEYEATLIGYRVALDSPEFQFLLPTGVVPNVLGAGGSVTGITEIDSPDQSLVVSNPTGPTADLEVDLGYAADALDVADNVALSDTFATYLTTKSLGLGKWLLQCTAVCSWTNSVPGSVTEGQIRVTPGTATATFEGPTGAGMSVVAPPAPATGEGDCPLGFACIVTVTASGTLELQGAGTDAAFCKISGSPLGRTLSGPAVPGTGYTAVRFSPSVT